MRFRNIWIPAGVFALTGNATALEVDPLVPPEVNVGGRVVATIDAGDGESALNIADSALLLRFSKYLFDDSRYGFGVVGFKKPEDSPDLDGEVHFHQLHAGMGGRGFEARLGRSRLRNSLVAFPTIREDDLLDFTHVANASARLHNEIYQLYGNVAELSLFPSARVSLLAGASARAESDGSGEVTRDRFNTAHAGIAYELPESIKFDRGVRYAAILLDAHEVRERDDARLYAVGAGLTCNLNSNPEGGWVWDAQVLHNRGLDVHGSLDAEVERARARSTAWAIALRYVARPYLQTRWQASLTVAGKSYSDFSGAAALAVAPGFLYRLGSQVDAVAQYIFQRYDDGLAPAYGRDKSHRAFVGLSFGLDYTLNESVGERQSILSIEHGMGTLGPAGGGH